jgi:uncharacterized membrane protein
MSLSYKIFSFDFFSSTRFFAILLHTLLTFSVFFNFLLRLSISSAFIFFFLQLHTSRPLYCIHFFCLFFFFISGFTAITALEPKNKKKKVKKRYRESETERELGGRKKKKEEEEEERRRRRKRALGGLDWTAGGGWR